MLIAGQVLELLQIAMVVDQLPCPFFQHLKFQRDYCQCFSWIKGSFTSLISAPFLSKLFLSNLGRVGPPAMVSPTDISFLRTLPLGNLGQVALPLISSPYQVQPSPNTTNLFTPLSSFSYSSAVIGLGVVFSLLGTGQAYSQTTAISSSSSQASHLPSTPETETSVSFQPLAIELQSVHPDTAEFQLASSTPQVALDQPELTAQPLHTAAQNSPSLKNSASNSIQELDVNISPVTPVSEAANPTSKYQLKPSQSHQPLAQTQFTPPPLRTNTASEAQDLLPLNPDPRQLQRPQETRDVEIDLNKPITLHQALDLAQRNNLTLQVAELQLQQSREALRQARALIYPNLDVVGDINRTENATFVVSRPPISINQATQFEVQQRTLTLLQTEQADAELELDQGIANLQALLQANQDTRQDITFDQQTDELNSGAARAATLAPIERVTPLTPLPSFLLPQSEGLADSRVDGEDTSDRDDLETSIARGTLSLTYDIFTSGFRSGTIGAAREQVRVSELALQAELDQLRLDVTNDYYDLQQADALVSVAEDAVNSARANLRDTKALEQAGLATQFDVLQADVQLAQATQDLTQGLNLQTIAQRQLVQRLNLSSIVNVTAADPAAIAGLWPLSLEDTILLTLKYRPELEQFLAQRRIAQFNRRVALSAIRPQIQFFANVEVVDQLDDDVLGAFGYVVGIQISLNFFDGGAAKAAAAQEEENIAIAETQFADTKNQLRFEVEQAYSTLQANYENIGTALRSVEQARENLRLAQLRFQAGIGTQLDITNAQADLTQQEGNLVDAVITYNRALAALERATSYHQLSQTNPMRTPAQSINPPTP